MWSASRARLWCFGGLLAPHLSLDHDVRQPASSAGVGARRVLGLGEHSCHDGAMRVRRNAALIKRASLWPCCSLCGRGG
ncbi:hypothetical protein B0H13DRAFT_2170497 [Mycena leptocephala]|nr:hypothetical protein B0H13DRAFT_2170497 [Mycena leptocephala]